MAQTTKASTTSTGSSMTAAEAKKWYEENFNRIVNFEKSMDAFKQFGDYTKNAATTISVYDKTQLQNYLRNIGNNEKNLRNLSWYLYTRSMIYSRLVKFYANMFDLNIRSVIPNYDDVEKQNNDGIMKSYAETIITLDKIRLQQEFYPVFLNNFIQDVFYGVVFVDETGIFIFPIPAEFAKIAGKYMEGDYGYAIDCSYFRNRQELLEYFPDPFQKLWDEYQKTNQKWQVMPPEYTLCTKYNTEDDHLIFPPFTPLFNSIINLCDLENIQAVADAQSIFKLLYLEMPLLKNSNTVDDWAVDPSLVEKYYNRLSGQIPEYYALGISPTELKYVNFESDASTDTTKIANATSALLDMAGGGEILRGSTINNTYAFKMATIANTEYAISSLLPQVSSWVNRMLKIWCKNPCKVKFAPVSVYTRADYREQLLSSAQYGLPVKLQLNALNGYNELDTLSMNYLEENILELHNKFVPLQSSYTQSGGTVDEDGYTSEVGQGAPTKDPGDAAN